MLQVLACEVCEVRQGSTVMDELCEALCTLYNIG